MFNTELSIPECARSWQNARHRQSEQETQTARLKGAKLMHGDSRPLGGNRTDTESQLVVDLAPKNI
jgi:hypothetical protein